MPRSCLKRSIRRPPERAAIAARPTVRNCPALRGRIALVTCALLDVMHGFRRRRGRSRGTKIRWGVKNVAVERDRLHLLSVGGRRKCTQDNRQNCQTRHIESLPFSLRSGTLFVESYARVTRKIPVKLVVRCINARKNFTDFNECDLPTTLSNELQT